MVKMTSPQASPVSVAHQFIPSPLIKQSLQNVQTKEEETVIEPVKAMETEPEPVKEMEIEPESEKHSSTAKSSSSSSSSRARSESRSSSISPIPKEPIEPQEEQTPVPPKKVEYFKHGKLLELGEYLSPNSKNYFKGCLFSPDGACILTTINGDGVKMFELPAELWKTEQVAPDRQIVPLKPVIDIKEAAANTVYDYCFYPLMNSYYPESCCFLVTRQHDPIKCYDAFDGVLRCSYRGYDAVDEVEAALSVCYSNDGQKIFAGYKKTVKVFDTARPGRDFQTVSTKTTSSALAASGEYLAAGSWNTIISVFDLRDGLPSPEFTLKGHRGGITYLRFIDDFQLISGARKDPRIFIWDMRKPSAPLYGLNRVVDTNQRIYFDISGDWMVSGSTDGKLRAWNLGEMNEGIITERQLPIYGENCCNGAAIHPFLPVLVTTSGQHRFESDEEKDEEEGEKKEKEEKPDSLNLWWCGAIQQKEPVVEVQ